MKADKCVFCGKSSPAVWGVCQNCLNAGGVDDSTANVEENLQNIAAIVNMADNVEKNLRTGISGILHIARLLEK